MTRVDVDGGAVGEPHPHLLHFRVSHYNEKARWALDFKGWAHRREALVPGFHIPRARFVSGQNQLPVLVVGDEAIAGSTAILEEIERRRPDPPLFPSDPKLRERARVLERRFDDEVAPDLRRIFWSTYLDRPADCTRMATMGESASARVVWRAFFPLMRPLLRRNMGVDVERVAHAKDGLIGTFDRLAREIGPSGYLVGDGFSVADLAVASVMTAVLRPPEFPYPLPEPWPPELVELRGRVANHAACQWVLEVYRRHRGTSSEVTSRAPSVRAADAADATNR